MFGNAAVAKVVMADWIDYLQLVRVDGRWLIVNVLWERKPERKLSGRAEACNGREPGSRRSRRWHRRWPTRSLP